jgi:hypothetical protein
MTAPAICRGILRRSATKIATQNANTVMCAVRYGALGIAAVNG